MFKVDWRGHRCQSFTICHYLNPSTFVTTTRLQCHKCGIQVTCGYVTTLDDQVDIWNKFTRGKDIKNLYWFVLKEVKNACLLLPNP